MRRPSLLVSLLASLGLAATVLAADPVVEATPPTIQAEREMEDLLRDLTIQRNAEIGTELAAVRLEVEELQVRLAATQSPSEQLALQRAIEAAKNDNQITVLRIQARYADLAGRPDVATEIREQIAQLEQAAAERLETNSR
jgi:hypothetical protein